MLGGALRWDARLIDHVLLSRHAVDAGTLRATGAAVWTEQVDGFEDVFRAADHYPVFCAVEVNTALPPAPTRPTPPRGGKRPRRGSDSSIGADAAGHRAGGGRVGGDGYGGVGRDG